MHFPEMSSTVHNQFIQAEYVRLAGRPRPRCRGYGLDWRQVSLDEASVSLNADRYDTIRYFYVCSKADTEHLPHCTG